ncbi:hypothetical protein GALMADRAFT_252430 [Galerina marginata CBS 339.88]|uniref:Uncharacterized protein n=1 Tax=Galerina marginata (strain CBS 339.88) TaxID=685588 RepID=A0A067SSL5_GALM3|nr:hypothetical protein GALMADRAFT_252430 [Galerina marginata CBS 339.88]
MARVKNGPPAPRVHTRGPRGPHKKRTQKKESCARKNGSRACKVMAADPLEEYSITVKSGKTMVRRQPSDPSLSEIPHRDIMSPEISLQLELPSISRNAAVPLPRMSNLENVLDPFNQNSDKLSISEIKNSVEQLNYAIDNTISNILEQFTTRKNRFKDLELGSAVLTPEEDPMKRVYDLLLDERLSDKDKCLILDASMHDKVCKLVFNSHFRGGCFYGLDATTAGIFEKVHDRVCKKEPWVVSQRWRAIAVSAISAAFPTHESDLASQTENIQKALGDLFLQAYPSDKPNFKKMINVIMEKEAKSLRDIINMARRLSIQIQQDIVSCRMLVTIAPRSTQKHGRYSAFNADEATSVWSEDMQPRQMDRVMGTFKFGLVQDSEGERRTIMLPAVITSAICRHFKKT